MGNISYNTIIKNKSLRDFVDNNQEGDKNEEDEDEVF